MKLIVAVIPPDRLKIVQEMLHSIGVSRMTICDGDGFSNEAEDRCSDPAVASEKPNVATHIACRSKVVLEIFVNDDFVEKTTATIRDLVAVGAVGDLISESEIFVIPSLDAITIDDGQRGPGAVS